MAAADYHLCDQCGANKTFYDADVGGYYDAESGEWLYGCEGVRGYRAYALCEKCEATHEIVIVSRDSDTRRMAETGTGSVRSTGSAVPNGQSPNSNVIPSSDLDALVERANNFGARSGNMLIAELVVAITSLRNQLTASEAREREMREALEEVTDFAGSLTGALWKAEDQPCIKRARTALTNTENHHHDR